MWCIKTFGKCLCGENCLFLKVFNKVFIIHIPWKVPAYWHAMYLYTFLLFFLYNFILSLSCTSFSLWFYVYYACVVLFTIVITFFYDDPLFKTWTTAEKWSINTLVMCIHFIYVFLCKFLLLYWFTCWMEIIR